MKALVIGAGGVGRAIANIASRRTFISSMVIADRTLARAEEAVARVKDSRFSAAQVNAAELEDIRDLIRKAKPDVVINAVDPRFVMPIFLACYFNTFRIRVAWRQLAKIGLNFFAVGTKWAQS